jgi:hypothetical protein
MRLGKINMRSSKEGYGKVTMMVMLEIQEQ